MRYAWYIHTDVVTAPSAASAVGMVSVNGLLNFPNPAGGDADRLRRCREGTGIEFKMVDGDGDAYYFGRLLAESEAGEGRWTLTPLNAMDEEVAFSPLDEFGMPDSGCTDIFFKTDAGEWEPL